MVIAKEWFTVNEAAEYLCVSRRTVYKLIKDRRLEAFRIGQERHQRFRKEDLDKVPHLPTEVKNKEEVMALNGKSDPVLVELWDNEKDAAYDNI